MVSSRHEAMHRLFHHDPGIFARATRALGLPFPDPIEVEILPTDLTEIKPIERHADTLMRIHTAEGDFLLIVEAQRGYDPDKSGSWPYYVAHAHEKYKLPVVLLVITDDESVARRARDLPAVGLPYWPTLTVRAVVLGPGNVPIVTDPAAAVEDVYLAMLSAFTHAQHPDIGAILKALAGAIMAVDPEERQLLSEMTELGLGSSLAAEQWRKFVPALSFYRSQTSNSIRAEGHAKGRAEGEAKAVLRVLERRGIEIPDAARARITGTTDVDLLDTWLDRAVTATSISDLLIDD